MQSTETITIPKAEYERIRAENEWLRRQIFGRKSERFVPKQVTNPNQLTLFYDGQVLEASAEETVGQIVESYERKKPQVEKKPHPGRMAIPEHLRREEVIIEPQEDTTGMILIGEDVTETLEYTPGEMWVKRTRRPKYARPTKEQQEGQSPIVQALAPDTPFNRCKAGVSLIAHILMSKYLEHLPLDRLLHRFARSGLKIPQQTIGDWVKRGINLLETLHERYVIWLLSSGYLQIDETTLKVLEDGKGKCHLGYLWVLLDPVSRAPYFHYHPGRDHGLPLKLLADFQGILQCDGYGAYETVQKLRPDQIHLVNCLAHMRRGFFEAKGNDEKRATEALAIIKQMYEVEAEARTLQLNHKERLALRQEKLKPLFDLFETWLNHHINQVTPSSPIGKATAYTLKRWKNMQIVLIDGSVEIDNNLVENAIRPVAIGRKNYLFAGSHEAAKRTAIIYTFVSACKHANINPEEWLVDVLNRVQDTKVTQLHTLFPINWQPVEET
jgi:transposase